MPPVSLQPLTVSLVQGATRWHDAPANRDYYGTLVRQARGSDLIVLPETFLSGFSNDTRASADTMEGEGVAYDVVGYRNAPPGLRVWCGCTVEADDIEALTPWLEWASMRSMGGSVPAVSSG